MTLVCHQKMCLLTILAVNNPILFTSPRLRRGLSYFRDMRILIPILALVMLAACSTEPDKYLIRVAGPAQGTTYHISYLADSANMDYRQSIDSILLIIDGSMSLWQPTSTISLINKRDSLAVDEHFLAVLKKSLQVSEKTQGAFDVTIAPLVKAWGFGPDARQQLDSAKVDSLIELTGYTKIQIEADRVRMPAGMQLDFNAIAQGYTVDVLARFLEEKQITNYLVEVGGEVRARGKNVSGNTWTVGVDKPEEHLDVADRFQIILALDSAALATSGNYRKFWVDEATGIKYVHTIDPKTGYPAKSRLLSASIVAADCITADAWATACMVVGVAGAQSFIETNPEIEGYLVYSDFDGNMQVWQSEGFARYVR